MSSEHSWYKSVFEATISGIFVYSRDARLVAVNPAGCRMSGWSQEEMLGMDPREFIAPESHGTFEAALEAVLRGESFQGEAKGLHRDGTLYDVEVRGTAVEIDGEMCFLSSLIDVSERNSLQRQLQQTQRMETVGQLAGGIAHDFNNLLGVILGFAELVKTGLGPDHPEQENLDYILEASGRAATLTSRLLASGRKQMISVEIQDLNEVVDAFAPILERALGGTVEVKTWLSSQRCLALVDVAQIEQVLLNLALNARDALPGGGRLTLELDNVAIDHTRDGLKPGSYVVLSVSDDGVGIAADDLGKLFEPFFTTRRDVGGSGLGLSMVHGIINQLGGNVTVYSELGVGTTFRIYLPEANAEPAPVEQPAMEATDLRGNESLAIVDDNNSLRQLIGSILGEQGYAVQTFNGASEILALSDAELGRPALLVTDVMMPELNGKDLFNELAQRIPGLQVLYVSGYTENVIVKLGFLNPGIDFLVKPFAARELAQKVREILNRRIPDAS